MTFWAWWNNVLLNDIKWYIKEDYNRTISNILLSHNSGIVFKKNYSYLNETHLYLIDPV